MINKAGYGIKKDYELEKWEISSMAILCKKCIGKKSFLRMIKNKLGQECKMCDKPFTTFSFKSNNSGKFKKTEICQLCSKLNNSCQACLNDLNLNISLDLRNKISKNNKIELLKSQGNKDYFNNMLLENEDLIKDEEIKKIFELNEIKISKNLEENVNNNWKYLNNKKFTNEIPILLIYFVKENMVDEIINLVNYYTIIQKYEKIKSKLYIVFNTIEDLEKFYKAKFLNFIILNIKLNISYVKETDIIENSFKYNDKYYSQDNFEQNKLKF